MNQAEQKIVQHLNEAYGIEQALERALEAQIAVAPRGSYRSGLETHLRETRDHAKRLQRRVDQLGGGEHPLQSGIGLLQSAVGQALALGKMPLDLLRRTGGQEKVLKNARDACATESLEIATYTAIERLARSLGDKDTAALAASIRTDEQRMLDRLMGELPALADAVLDAEAPARRSRRSSKAGTPRAKRGAGKKVRKAPRRRSESAKRTARSRRAAGATRADGQIKAATAPDPDLPIANYANLPAPEILERLPELSQIELAKVDSYERRTEKRATIVARIESLHGTEPWSGYDELGISEIRSVLDRADEQRIKRVRAYERAHKRRTGVLEATQRELASV